MNPSKLPHRFVRFFEWFCKPDLFEELQGDLEEAFEENKQLVGTKRAKNIYRMEVLKMLRPSVIRFGQTHSKFNHLIMLKNYLKTSFRSLLKRKSYFTINVSGLALGMASFSLIALYVVNELTYDQFHTKHANIYRISNKAIIRGELNHNATTNAPMAGVLLDNYPELLDATRVLDPGAVLIGKEQAKISEDGLLFADSSFFHVFDFGLKVGNPKTVLNQPRSIVLSESYARKYFGEEEAVGKFLMLEEDTVSFRVTGVFANVPPNSHLQFDMLASLSSREESRVTHWIGTSLHTYALLRPDADVELLQDKTKDIFYQYVAPEIEYYTGLSIADWEAAGNSVGFAFTPIRDIHLHSTASGELEPVGNMAYIYIYALIGIAIIFVAIFNFVNLSTAHSTSRAKEVGIRKVIGSTRKMLIAQFMVESMVISFAAAGVCLVLVAFFKPDFNDLVQKNLGNGLWSSYATWVYVFGLSLGVGLLAGSYPAFALSRFLPVRVLKGNVSSGNRSGWLRNLLVTLQFAVSITIIICTLVVYQQIEFMLAKNLGFEKDQILVIKRPDWLNENLEVFKTDLLNNPNIKTVSNSATLPGKKYELRSYRRKGESETFLFLNNLVSYEYQDLLGLELVAGRFFSRDIASDSSAVILNESAAKAFGFGDPIGKPLTSAFATGPLHIIGVVKDYNIESLHKNVVPVSLELYPKVSSGYMGIRLNTKENLTATVDYIDEVWTNYAGDKPLQYFFFDEEYDRLYQSEMATGKMLSVFATLSILIACMGLIGLVSYMASNRQKEIGIRKVLGATIGALFGLLSNQILRLIAVAIVMAWPLSYAAANYWLQNFSNRKEPEIWIYVGSTAAMLLIVGGVVGVQTIRTARTNPVESLRQE